MDIDDGRRCVCPWSRTARYRIGQLGLRSGLALREEM